MKKWHIVTLVVAGVLLLGLVLLVVAAIVEDNNRVRCWDEEQFITVAQKGCNQDPSCTCSDKNLIGQCTSCTCRTTRQVCR